MSYLGFLDFLQIASAGLTVIVSVITSLSNLKREDGKWTNTAFILLTLLGISLMTSIVSTILSADESKSKQLENEKIRLSDSLINHNNYIDLANRSERALVRANDAVNGIEATSKDLQMLLKRTRATLDSVEQQLVLQRQAYVKTNEVLQRSSEVYENVDRTYKKVRGLSAPISRWEFEIIFRVNKTSKLYQTVSKWARDIKERIASGDSALEGIFYKGYPARSGKGLRAILFKNATNIFESGLPVFTGFVGFRMTVMDTIRFKNDSTSLGGGILTIYSNNTSAYSQDEARRPATIISYDFTTEEMQITTAIVKFYLDYPKIQPLVSVADLEENVMLFEVYSSEDCAISPIQGFLYSNNHKEKFTIGILPVRSDDKCNRVFYKPSTMIIERVSDDYDRLFNSFLEER